MILREKVIVISGVGPGLGRHLAIQAAKEGARIVLGARSEALISEIAQQICASGAHCIAIPTDATNGNDCRALCKKATDTFGRIDGLVNAAYHYDAPIPIDEVCFDTWVKSFDVNVIAALRMV